jgi:glycerophosphoryl diester phosphodiesterase
MLRVGHRGAAGHAPENTLASFRKALEIGVDGVECDIHVCKSGEAVVIHDATLERTTSGKGKVSDFTLKELKTLDAGKGEQIPTLEELLKFIDKRVTLYIELKEDEAVDPVAKIIAHHAENEGWGYEKLPVLSFDHRQLVRIRQINTRILTGATLVGIPLDYAACAARAGAWSVNPCIEYVDGDFVADARSRGLKTLVWTVNKPEQIAKARALGADALVSDFPDRL